MQDFKEIKELSNNFSKNRILCPNCGHSLTFEKVDKIICNWCKHYVFKDKLKESINRNK